MPTIVCSDPKHAQRSAEPDWAATLGTTNAVGEAKYLCGACGRLQPLEAAESNTHASTTIQFNSAGTEFIVVYSKVYEDGTVVGTTTVRQTIANAVTGGVIRDADVTQLRATINALLSFANPRS